MRLCMSPVFGYIYFSVVYWGQVLEIILWAITTECNASDACVNICSFLLSAEKKERKI